MSLAVLYSRAQVGMDAPLVTVEVHLSNGLPSLSIVGLPETAVKESKDRVRGAIHESDDEILGISAYLIPTPSLVETIRERNEQGVRIRLLTNSLASTNHVPAHAAYRHHRAGEHARSEAESVLGPEWIGSLGRVVIR